MDCPERAYIPTNAIYDPSLKEKLPFIMGEVLHILFFCLRIICGCALFLDSEPVSTVQKRRTKLIEHFKQIHLSPSISIASTQLLSYETCKCIFGHARSLARSSTFRHVEGKKNTIADNENFLLFCKIGTNWKRNHYDKHIISLIIVKHVMW